MSVHRMQQMARAQTVMNTLGMQKPLGKEAIDRIHYLVLAHLDLCKRGEGLTFSVNLLTIHLTIIMLSGSKRKNRALYDLGNKAYAALLKACDRAVDGDELDIPVNLTTGEYKLLRAAFSTYLLHVLPKLHWKEYLGAEATAYARLKVEPEMQTELQTSSMKLNLDDLPEAHVAALKLAA